MLLASIKYLNGIMCKLERFFLRLSLAQGLARCHHKGVKDNTAVQNMQKNVLQKWVPLWHCHKIHIIVTIAADIQ